MFSRKDIIETIQKMALGPGGTAPVVPAQEKGPSKIGPSVDSASSEKPSAPKTNDVKTMQNLLLDLIHSGFLPKNVLGGMKEPVFANGAWGPKTNAVLNATVNKAEDTLKLINELRGEGVRLNIDVYNPRAITAFRSWIPELKGGRADLSPEDQSRYAQELEQHLKSIKALNSQYLTQIGSKGEFRGLLAGEPIEQYSTPHQMTTDKETEEEVVKILSNPTLFSNVPISIPGLATSMPLIALTSKEQYLKWANGLYAKSKQKPTEEQLTDLFQRIIKPQLDKKVS
jgi:hypothetical protein